MPKRTLTLSALYAAVALASSAHAMPMGGAFSGRVDSQTPQVLGPNEMKVQQTAKGTNTGPGTPFDGANVQWSENIKLKNGQGTHEGTITFITPSGTTVSAYSGMVETDTLGRVTAKGRFKSIEATGEFAGLKGDGEYKAAYSSPTAFTGDWKGDFKLPAQKSSKR